MSNKVLQEILSANLTRINDWVKFAEAKNAALLTFSSAWLVAICSLWSNDKTPAAIRWSIALAAPSVVLAAVFAILSLLPVSQKKAPFDTAGRLTSSNLLFHGNISRLNVATGLNSFASRYSVENSDSAAGYYTIDLATQVIETSRIAERKFHLFRLGLFAIISGFAIAILFFTIWIIFIR